MILMNYVYERKVTTMGNALCVTIPKDWADGENLRKGSLVHVTIERVRP